jgi:hypothetical protein
MGQSAMLPDAQQFSMEKTRSFTPTEVGIPLIANPIISGLKKNSRINRMYIASGFALADLQTK